MLSSKNGGGRGNGGEDRGRGGRSGCRGCRGNKNSSAKGSGSTSLSMFIKGANAALEDHVFDYGSKKEGAAEQMRHTWESLVNCKISQHGPHMGNELRKRREFKIPEPQYYDSVKVRKHEAIEMT
jgi:hypothetical protein